MGKRPVSVTIIAIVYIAAGAVGFAAHLSDFRGAGMVWVEILRVLAIVCGVYLLRGRGWARVLAVAWIGFHVVLSAFQTLPQLAVHGLLCAVFAYFLFRPSATRYFRAVGAQ